MPHPERKYTSRTFNYDQDFKNTEFRKNPELYQVGRGEQGVLMVEPYKSEILPHWRFKDPETAQKSAEKILELFTDYKKQNDFVGMDMARKFLQMGYTRARRYANHKGGKKYARNPQNEATPHAEAKAREQVLPQQADALTNEKAQAARIFYGYYLQAREDPEYKKQKKEHQQKYG